MHHRHAEQRRRLLLRTKHVLLATSVRVILRRWQPVLEQQRFFHQCPAVDSRWTCYAFSKEKDKGEANVSAGIIPFLERHTTNEFLLKGRAYTLQRLIKQLLSKDGYADFESSVSIAHLENRIAGALSLGSKEEFRLYLYMYAKRIGAEGHKDKVEELLNSLLGGILQEKRPSSYRDDSKGWLSKDEILCGWDRKELLKGVVMILGRFRGSPTAPTLASPG